VGDDAKNDRSHKAALAATATARYPETGDLLCEDEAEVEKKKSADVTVIILRDKPQADGGTPVVTTTHAENMWKITKERYAQVGVDITYSVSVADPPAGVDLSDGLQITDTDTSKVLSAEAEALIDALGTTGSEVDIHCFYVMDPKWGSSSLYGVAVADYWFDASEDAYLYNLIINDSTNKPFNAAHELSHLLVDGGHESSKVNVLYRSTSTSNVVTGTKRLSATQETEIQGNSHVN
jgi:hypothetical protein